MKTFALERFAVLKEIFLQATFFKPLAERAI